MTSLKETSLEQFAMKCAAVFITAVLAITLMPYECAWAAEPSQLAAGSSTLLSPQSASGDVSASVMAASLTASVATFGDASVPQGVRAERASKHSIKVSWKKASHAKSYAVYRWTDGKYGHDGKWKRIAVVASKSTSWCDKKLKANTSYRYAVAACKGKKGKKPGAKSYWVETCTYGKGAKYVDAGKVVVEEKSLDVKIGAVDHVASKLLPSAKGKKVGRKGCKVMSGQIRLVSTSNTVVPSLDGQLQASRTGSCAIRVLAPNGVLSAPIKVKVMKHDHPGEFKAPTGGNLQIADPELLPFLNANADKIHSLTNSLFEGCFESWHTNVAWMIERNPDGSITWLMPKSANEQDVFPNWMKESDRQIMSDLFHDDRFNNSFYLTRIELIYDTIGDAYFAFSFHSDAFATANNVPSPQFEICGPGGFVTNGESIANNWCITDQILLIAS